MKVAELLTESTASVQDAVLKAMEAAMVRHAQIGDIEVTEDEVFWSSLYEFPEHRTGLSKEVRKVAKPIGKVDAENFSQRGEYVTSYTIRFNDPISSEEVESLDAAIKAKFKDSLFR